MPQFFPNFAWAVPKAFKEPLSDCRFEEGDILYDRKEAYLPWGEGFEVVRFSAAVIYPPRGVSTRIEPTRSVFKQNWPSKAELELTDYFENTKQSLKTTQGRLFTLLWKGKIDVLSTTADEPTMPFLLDYLKVRKEHRNKLEGSIPHFEKLLQDRPENKTFFIMAHDLVNDVSDLKYHTVKSALEADFAVQEMRRQPKQVGIPNGESLLPTIFVVCFALEEQSYEKIAEKLKQVLYKPSKESKKETDRFKLDRHGLLYSCERNTRESL